MMRRLAAAAVLACAAAPPVLAQDPAPAVAKQPGPRTLAVKSSVVTDFPVAAHRLEDVDRDGRDDLLVIGRGGEVRVWRHEKDAESVGADPFGVLVLPEPDRSVLALADVLATGTPQLCVLSRRGLEAYPAGPDGAFARAPVVVSKRTTLSFRTGAPTFADVLRDVNGDGRPDLIRPRGENVELWLWNAPAADGAPPEYRLAASVKVDVSRDRAVESGALSDVLESSFRIPGLKFEDVNGDGRRDLVVEDGKIRAFHLSKADGTLPAEPGVTLDLSKYEDTTPAAEVRLGRTLAGGDDQRMESTDLDGDGIPDYVISHRRKIWVFLGTTEGPQFTALHQTLRVSDDVSAMLVAPLDGDGTPDLLLLRVQVPTVATILRGLVASWDVDIGAVGYANDGKGSFGTTPTRKGELALRLPAILGLLKDPEAVLGKFEALAKKFRRGFVWGDFDADGSEDAAVASVADRRLDVWFGVPRTGRDLAPDESELGEVFFGDERVWDIERVLQWLGDYADRRFARVTQGRDPSLRIPLRGDDEATLEGVAAGNLDGAGAAEIVVAYTDADGRGVFDILR